MPRHQPATWEHLMVQNKWTLQETTSPQSPLPVDHGRGHANFRIHHSDINIQSIHSYIEWLLNVSTHSFDFCHSDVWCKAEWVVSSNQSISRITQGLLYTCIEQVYVHFTEWNLSARWTDGDKNKSFLSTHFELVKRTEQWTKISENIIALKTGFAL